MKTVPERGIGRGCQLTGSLLLAVVLFLQTAGATPPQEWGVDDTAHAEEIREAAQKWGLDPLLVRALVFEESRFDTFAKGSCGEIGLMQVLPSGAAADWTRLTGTPVSAFDLVDPRINLEIGCWYLARAMARWKEHPFCTALALAQYNAGERRAAAWSKDPQRDVIEQIDFPTTQKYVSSILARYARYRRMH